LALNDFRDFSAQIVFLLNLTHPIDNKAVTEMRKVLYRTAVIGDKDTTAIGKDLAPANIRATLGDYPVLGKKAAAEIPHAPLVEFGDLGHAPQIPAPDRFRKAVPDFQNGSTTAH
jgi:pimeloyl-ACP methyl ester carboxylesterase